jgi:HK97 family phage major capsid protein
MLVKTKVIENGVEVEKEVEMTEKEFSEYEAKENIKTLVKDASKEISKEAVSEIKNSMELEIKNWLSEQKEAITKAVGVYSPEAKKDRAGLNKYFKEFAKALIAEDVAKLKELSTDATGTPYGGYVVDTELDANIRLLLGEYGVARSEFEFLTLAKHTYKSNELATDIIVGWADEAGSLTSTQYVLGQHELSLKKLFAIIGFTSELLEDSEIDLWSFVSGRVAENMAYKEDLAFFMGDGTATYGSFTGLVKQTTTVNQVVATGSTFASLTADDLLNMIDATPIGALRNAKFYMHRTIMSIIRKLKDDNGQYIFQRPSEGGPATIWGYPVRLVEVMPTSTQVDQTEEPFILFGDLRQGAVFGAKGGLRIEKFDAGTIRNVANNADINLITSDRKAVRFIERVGYVQMITTFRKPITVLATAPASA